MDSEILRKLTRHFKERGDTLSIDCLKFYLARLVYLEEYSSADEYANYVACRAAFAKKAASTGALIYGAGDEGRLMLKELNKCGVKVYAFMDTYKVLNGENSYLDLPIITLKEYTQKYNGIPIVITPVGVKDEIQQYLENNGIFNGCVLVEQNKELSKIFAAQAVIPEAARLCELSGKKRYFSLPELIPGSSEVFVDVGAKDGNSTRDFIDWCNGNYLKAFVFEPESEFYKTTVSNLHDFKNISVFQKGCSETTGITRFNTLGLFPVFRNMEQLRFQQFGLMKY